MNSKLTLKIVKVLISEQSGRPALELEESREMGGTWDQDWDSLLPPLVDSDMPAYFLYRSCLSKFDSFGIVIH